MSLDRHTRELIDAAVRTALARREREIRGIVVEQVFKLMAEFAPAINKRVREQVEEDVADLRATIALARLQRTVEKINQKEAVQDLVREEVVACLQVYGVDLPEGPIR